MEHPLKTNKKALAAVLVGNSVFGLSFLFSKLALELTIPSVLIAIRFTVAFVVLNLIVFFGKRIKKSDGSPLIEFSLKGKPLKPILLLSLFQPVLYYITENYGIVYTSSAYAGIIIAVVPVAGVVLDLLILHVHVTKKQIICAIASVLGVAITTIGAVNMKSSVLGTVLLLVAVFSGSMFYVFSKSSSKYYSALERTYVMFGVGSVVYIIFALVQCAGSYDTLILPAIEAPVFWGSILYLSVVSSVIAFLLLNYGSNFVTVSQGTLFVNLTTVISILAGVLILGEPFNWQQAIGAAIILVSVYIAR